METILILSFIVVFFSILFSGMSRGAGLLLKRGNGFLYVAYIVGMATIRAMALIECGLIVLMACYKQISDAQGIDTIIEQCVESVPLVFWIIVLAASYVLEYAVRFAGYIASFHLLRYWRLMRKINAAKGSEYKVYSFISGTLPVLETAAELFEQGRISREQFSILADPIYTTEQLQQIISGYSCGLSDEQVALYTDRRYTVLQMGEIRAGSVCGLLIDEIKQYASPETDSHYMFVIRNEISRQKRAENKGAGAASKEGDRDEV